jgi:hypothetical protein
MAKINALPVLLAAGALVVVARIGTAELAVRAVNGDGLAQASLGAATAEGTPDEVTAEPEAEPPTGQALVVSEAQGAIAAGIYARAHYLLGKARESGDAGKWLSKYQNDVAWDVTETQQAKGLFTGEPDLFTVGTNRAGELAAVSTALLWLEHPHLADRPPAYTLAALVDAVSASRRTMEPATDE